MSRRENKIRRKGMSVMKVGAGVDDVLRFSEFRTLRRYPEVMPPPAQCLIF